MFLRATNGYTTQEQRKSGSNLSVCVLLTAGRNFVWDFSRSLNYQDFSPTRHWQFKCSYKTRHHRHDLAEEIIFLGEKTSVLFEALKSARVCKDPYICGVGRCTQLWVPNDTILRTGVVANGSHCCYLGLRHLGGVYLEAPSQSHNPPSQPPKQITF